MFVMQMQHEKVYFVAVQYIFIALPRLRTTSLMLCALKLIGCSESCERENSCGMLTVQYTCSSAVSVPIHKSTGLNG